MKIKKDSECTLYFYFGPSGDIFSEYEIQNVFTNMFK